MKQGVVFCREKDTCIALRFQKNLLWLVEDFVRLCAPTVDCTLTLLKMMKETYSKKGWNVHNPALPILFISGGDDPCLINLKRFHHSAGFMNTVGYNNVSSIIYLGMRHEVLNEIGKEDIWQEIEDFVAQRGS